MKKLYSHVLKLCGTYAIGNVAQCALSILPQDFGILALMSITITLFTRVIITPINGALNRFYYKPDYKDKNGILLYNLFSLLIIKTVFLTLLFWYLGGFLCRLLFQSDKFIHIVQLYTFVILLTPLSSFLLSLIKLREMAKYYIFLSLSKLVLSCGLIVYLLIIQRLGVLAVIYGNIFGLFFISIMCLPILSKYIKFKISK